MVWKYGVMCGFFYINVNLNNLSYLTMKEPALRFLAAYVFMKGSYLIRNFILLGSGEAYDSAHSTKRGCMALLLQGCFCCYPVTAATP